MSDLVLVNFESLDAMLKWRNVRSGLKIYVGKANNEIGTIARMAIRSYIQGQSPIKNAPVTKKIKGFDRPLYRTGTLAKSIQKMKKPWHTVYVGVLQDKMVSDPDSGTPHSLLQVAETLHEGKVIAVTDKMRGYFQYMHKRFPHRYRPIPPSVKHIVIPARPFLLSSIDNRLVLQYSNLWAKAVADALLHKVKARSNRP